MTTKKETPTLLERFEKHAPNKSAAKRIYNLTAGKDICNMTLNELLAIKGLGRAAALIVMEVACDLAGKK